jgi:alpha-galactosidase
MLTNLTSSLEEMAVEGALTGNPRLVFQAIAHDPLTASVLSLAEIKQMVNEMFRQNREYLPQFKHFEI